MRVKMSKQPPPVPTASAVGPCPTVIQIVGWYVGWFGVKRPFETVFQSISGRLPKGGRKRKERIDESCCCIVVLRPR